jgi:hypothetical protein
MGTQHLCTLLLEKAYFQGKGFFNSSTFGRSLGEFRPNNSKSFFVVPYSLPSRMLVRRAGPAEAAWNISGCVSRQSQQQQITVWNLAKCPVLKRGDIESLRISDIEEAIV